jgi:uncharacterized protein YeaO (DUF488 family)
MKRLEAMHMPVMTKRIYEPASPRDGYRVLVDRIWPRGISRDEAALDAWMKELAPTDALRKWFHADPSRWGEFRRRYLSELKGRRDNVRGLAERAGNGPVTLLFAARDERHNHAVVLKQYLKMLGAE